MRWIAVIAVSALALGCQLDTSAAGDAADPDEGGSDGTSAETTSTGSGQGTTEDTGAPPEPTTTGTTSNPGTTSSGEDSSNDDGSSSGQPGCPAETQVAWAFEGVVEPPMELIPSSILKMEVGRSWALGAGTLTVQLQTECEGPVYLWGLAWDNTSGHEPANPDSYFVTVDDEDEIVWDYGCSNGDAPDQSWRWSSIESFPNGDCSTEPVELSLPAGMHTIVVRNREAGVAEDVARIGGIVLSHDPDADPTTFIDPP